MKTSLETMMFCFIFCCVTVSSAIAQNSVSEPKFNVSDISISFGQESPLVLEWTEFKQGIDLGLKIHQNQKSYSNE
jgi:hypothetical protein